MMLRLRPLAFLAVVAVTHVAAIKVTVFRDDGGRWDAESANTCVDLPGEFVNQVRAYRRQNDKYAVTLWGNYDCTGPSRSLGAGNDVALVDESLFLSERPRTMSISTCSERLHSVCRNLYPTVLAVTTVPVAIRACFGSDEGSPRSLFAVLVGAVGLAALHGVWNSRCRFCAAVPTPGQTHEESEDRLQRRHLRVDEYLPEMPAAEGETCDLEHAVFARLVDEASGGSLDARRLENLFFDLLGEYGIHSTWAPVKGVFGKWMDMMSLDQNGNGILELDEFGPLPKAFSEGM